MDDLLAAMEDVLSRGGSLPSLKSFIEDECTIMCDSSLHTLPVPGEYVTLDQRECLVAARLFIVSNHNGGDCEIIVLPLDKINQNVITN